MLECFRREYLNLLYIKYHFHIFDGDLQMSHAAGGPESVEHIASSKTIRGWCLSTAYQKQSIMMSRLTQKNTCDFTLEIGLFTQVSKNIMLHYDTGDQSIIKLTSQHSRAIANKTARYLTTEQL